MKKIKLLFETKMYLISLLPFLFLIRFSVSENYGNNKTVGWVFNFNDFSNFATYILLMFFVLFLFLALIKAKTNLILSVVYFFCISFCCLFKNGYRNILLIDRVFLTSILIFVVLFIYSIYYKFKKINDYRTGNN